MKEIKLTKGYVAVVDDEDYERLMDYKWHVCFQPPHDTPYARRGEGKNPNKTTISMHHHIMGIPFFVTMDHQDRNGLNNQKVNLRVCTASQNQMNAKLRKDSSSGYKGVTWKKEHKKWAAQIQVNKKRKHLGYFLTKEEAARRYNQAATALYEEYARLNQI